jgi:hypothetical protein
MGMMTQGNMGSFSQSPTSAWVFISGAAELTNCGSPIIAIALTRFFYLQIHPQTIETARNKELPKIPSYCFWYHFNADRHKPNDVKPGYSSHPDKP